MKAMHISLRWSGPRGFLGALWRICENLLDGVMTGRTRLIGPEGPTSGKEDRSERTTGRLQ